MARADFSLSCSLFRFCHLPHPTSFLFPHAAFEVTEIPLVFVSGDLWTMDGLVLFGEFRVSSSAVVQSRTLPGIPRRLRRPLFAATLGDPTRSAALGTSDPAAPTSHDDGAGRRPWWSSPDFLRDPAGWALLPCCDAANWPGSCDMCCLGESAGPVSPPPCGGDESRGGPAVALSVWGAGRA